MTTKTGDTTHLTTAPVPADRASAWRSGTAGLIVGPLFVGLIVITTALEWTYMHEQWGWSAVSHHYQGAYPSGLSTGPWGFLMMANFFVAGCLVLTFTPGLVATMAKGASRVVLRIALTVMGVALLLSTAKTDFHYRPTTDVSPTTWHGWVHNIAFYLLILGSLTASTAGARAMRRTPAWRPWSLPTLLPALAIVAGLALPAPWSIYVMISTIFGWLTLTGLRLRHLAD